MQDTAEPDRATSARWKRWGIRVLLVGGALAYIMLPPKRGPAIPVGAVPSGTTILTFSDLSSFTFDLKVGDSVADGFRPAELPTVLLDAHHQTVALRGFMLPLEGDQNGVTVFMMNGSYDMCFFGAPVRPNDWVLVHMRPGVRIPFGHLPITVVGRFEVGVDAADGRLTSFYRIDDAVQRVSLLERFNQR